MAPDVGLLGVSVGHEEQARFPSLAAVTRPPVVNGSLLLTADDFGLCRQVNEAVCLLHDRGVVHSTSLVANSELFDLSLRQLQERPGLQVGVHLNLTDGKPVLSSGQVPSLVNSDGAFHGGRHYRVLGRVLSGRLSTDEVRAEWTAQLARVAEAGIRIHHLNSHGHIHLVPAFHAVVLDLVEQFAIPFLRLLLSVDSLRHRAFGSCSRAMLAEMRRRDMCILYPRHVLGLGRQGALTETFFLERLGRATDGLTELIVHPSAAGNEYHRRWRYAGEVEMNALLNVEVVTLLRQRARSALPDVASA